MSVDMNSQGSDSNEEDYDPNCEEEEEEEDEDPGDIEDYYVGVASDVEQQGADAFDPEEYQFTCLTYKESEGALNEHMTSLASVLKAVDAHCHQLHPPYGTDTSPILLNCLLKPEFNLIHQNMSPQPIPLTTVQCVCSLCGRKTYFLWPVSTSFAAAAGSSTAQCLSRTAWVWESLVWLRTVHFVHQRTLCFRCFPVKN